MFVCVAALNRLRGTGPEDNDNSAAKVDGIQEEGDRLSYDQQPTANIQTVRVSLLPPSSSLALLTSVTGNVIAGNTRRSGQLDLIPRLDRLQHRRRASITEFQS